MNDLAWGLRSDQKLSDSVKSIDLTIILGPDTNMLKRRGVVTLGNILHMNTEELKDFPSMGTSKFNRIFRVISAICENVNDEGKVRWDSIDHKLFHKNAPLKGLIKDGILLQNFWGSSFYETILSDSAKSILLYSILGPDANILQQNGFETLGELLLTSPYRIYDLRGMGTTKFDRIFRLISAICANLNDEGEVNWNSIDQKLFHRDVSLNRIIHFRPKNELSSAIKSIPLGVIHLEVEGRPLKKRGISTVGDFLELKEEELNSIKGLGKKKIQRIHDVLQAIRMNILENDEVDWVTFAKSLDIPVIPSTGTPWSGEDFLQMVPGINLEIIASCDDPMEKMIFSERLIKKNSQQKTLDALGKPFGVTRERIRQKEAKLLSGLSNGILYNEYCKRNFRFTPEFSKFFRDAAKSFSNESDSLTFEYFITKLADVWKVKPLQILPHWAFITAILTSKAKRPEGMRADDHIPLSLCLNLPNNIAQKPLTQLLLKKHIKDFHKVGILTIGDAIEHIVKGDTSIDRKSETFSVFNRILNDIEKTRDDAEYDQFFWLRYARNAGLKVLPSNIINGPEEFLSCLNETLLSTLEINTNRKYLTDIFRLRTSRSLNDRLTLEKTANALGTVGPSVKNIETELVTLLHSQLIEKNFTSSNAFFHKKFLKYWEEANEVYEKTKEFTLFKESLSVKWDVNFHALAKHADLIWTVLNLYPQGRNVTRKVEKRIPDHNQSPLKQKTGVIKLRGFRNVF